jgi:3-hydroxybutyrate dehydrogenase
VVTGSTSGIGAGIAEALAAAGANVMLNGLGDAREIDAQVKRLAAAHGVRVAYHNADLSRGSEVMAMVKSAQDEFGSVDILVNNAGIQFVSPIDEFPEEKWEAIIAINFSSNFYAIKAALPGMRERKWGRIVNIASAHGLVASPFKSAYVGAKHGVMGLTKTVALEVAEQGITCNAICPGYVHTPLVEAQIEAQAKVHNLPREQVIREVMLSAQPTKRFVGIDEIGGLVVFLCSPLAASITGAALPIDGGWVAR